jgi:anti-sigma factor RsiW
MSGVAIGLTCQELAELVTDYLEGVLPRRQRIRFRLHIAGCTNCRRYVAQMRVTIAATGRIRAEDMAPEVRDELLAAFRGWKAGEPGQG